VDKARNDLTQLKEQVTILRAKKDSITSRLKHLLSSELELIASLETGEERARPAADEERPDLTSEKTEIEEIIRSLDR
jgi:hypothetical protein